MRIAVAFAGLIALTGSAQAGDVLVSQAIPRPDVVHVVPPRYEIATLVHSLGLEPIGAPVRVGNTFVQRAIDLAGTPLRVTIDVSTGQVLAIHPVVAVRNYTPPPAYGQLYAERPPYDGPYGHRPYGYGRRYTVLPRGYEYDDDDVMPAPRSHVPAAPERSAAVNPRTPVPKPRPQNLPAQTKAPVPTQKPVAAAPQAPKPLAPSASPAPSAPAPGTAFPPTDVP